MGYVKVATAGARLRCSMGLTESTLTPTSAPTVFVENKPVATIRDATAVLNIQPFGTCQAPGNAGAPCFPMICGASWSGNVGLPFLTSLPALPATGTLHCARGGEIGITDCGQSTVDMAVVSEPPKSEKGGLSFMDKLQIGLDGTSLLLDATGVGGVVSWLPDLANAGISAARGDWAGAGMSLGASIPFVGAVGNVGRIGRIYKVQGKTPTGKPYIGRTKQSSPDKRGKSDGRDRKDAEIVDTYPANDTAAGRKAEQEAMNREGGVENLDNKRNEIRAEDWNTHDIPPPR